MCWLLAPNSTLSSLGSRMVPTNITNKVTPDVLAVTISHKTRYALVLFSITKQLSIRRRKNWNLCSMYYELHTKKANYKLILQKLHSIKKNVETNVVTFNLMGLLFKSCWNQCSCFFRPNCLHNTRRQSMILN